MSVLEKQAGLLEHTLFAAGIKSNDDIVAGQKFCYQIHFRYGDRPVTLSNNAKSNRLMGVSRRQEAKYIPRLLFRE